MPYDRLRERLADPPAPECSTLPDGSVDRFCAVSGGGEPFETREAFARAILDGDRSSFDLVVESTEPGGQAVNAAQQLHALGGEVTCYGHLDDPVFDALPFGTVSMGDPAVVDAVDFAGGDVMFVEGTADWSLADLRRVADLRDVFGVDAVCCSNWRSFPGLTHAFETLADLGIDLPRVPFVFDPGDVAGGDPEAVEALSDALGGLQGTFDVVFDANRAEVRATAAILADAPSDDAERLAAVREATGVEAAVMHAPEGAVAATAEGVTTVEGCSVDDPKRHTGGGDHFSGGLSYALANGWEWDVALACGNACAAHYVGTAIPASAADAAAVAERASSR